MAIFRDCNQIQIFMDLERGKFGLRLAYDEMGQPVMPGNIQDAIEGLLRHDPSAAGDDRIKAR